MDIYFLYSQPLTQIAIIINMTLLSVFFLDIRVVDLGLRLELKSDLGLEKAGDHWYRVSVERLEDLSPPV